jgi:hypothetical protein
MSPAPADSHRLVVVLEVSRPSDGWRLEDACMRAATVVYLSTPNTVAGGFGEARNHRESCSRNIGLRHPRCRMLPIAVDKLPVWVG